ncbi:hypothetical protein ACX0G7_20355 [Flavitalea antarctica]
MIISRTEKVTTEKFDILLEGKPVAIKASRYQTHNNEIRFRVSINDSPVYIFAYDEELERAVAIDQSSAIAAISPKIEEVIGARLAAAA